MCMYSVNYPGTSHTQRFNPRFNEVHLIQRAAESYEQSLTTRKNVSDAWLKMIFTVFSLIEQVDKKNLTNGSYPEDSANEDAYHGDSMK